MASDKADKAATFQGIRPTQCRCTDKEVCEFCKENGRRNISWDEAVRESNREYIRTKGEER